MNATRAARPIVVTSDGDGVVSHVGVVLVAEVADRLGFTAVTSARMVDSTRRSRRHDPGVVLTQLAVMLVDGGDCLSDLKTLRNQPELFGNVARRLHTPVAIDANGFTLSAPVILATDVATGIQLSGGVLPAAEASDLALILNTGPHYLSSSSNWRHGSCHLAHQAPLTRSTPGAIHLYCLSDPCGSNAIRTGDLGDSVSGRHSAFACQRT